MAGPRFVSIPNIVEERERNSATVLWTFSFLLGTLTFAMPLVGLAGLIFSYLAYRKNRKIGLISSAMTISMILLGSYFYGWTDFAFRGFAYVLFVITPIVFWFILMRWLDRSEPEPLRLQQRALLFGTIGTMLAFGVEYAVDHFGLRLSQFSDAITLPTLFTTGSLLFLLSMFLAGPIEELFKYLMLRTAVYAEPAYNQVFDGVLYGVSIALGFSLVENTSYYLALCSCDPSAFLSTVAVRGVLATCVHVLATGIMGFYLGKAKFAEKSGWRFLILGLVYASLIHGSYDVLISLPIPGLFSLVALGVFIIGAIFFVRLSRPDVRMLWAPILTDEVPLPTPAPPQA